MVESLFLTALYALLSYILGRTIALQSLQIGSLSLWNLVCFDVNYSGTLYQGTYHFTFTASRIFIRFHWPTKTKPRWLTFTTQDILYKSDTADISCGQISSTCWIFPVLLRQSVGPWMNVESEDLRIRVKKSTKTPYFVHLLRQNIISAVLTGDIYRVDDFGTKIQFSGITERPVAPEEKGDDGDEEGYQNGCTESSLGCETSDSIGTSCGGFKEAPRRYTVPKTELHPEQDELRISAFVRGLHLSNHEGRSYNFEGIDSQFRRNWVSERGSFVTVAKGCRWTQVPSREQMGAMKSGWSQLWSSISHFPIDLVRISLSPMTAVNLYVPEANIVFDEFRLRDAELVVQGISLIREKMYNADIQWQDVFADALCRAIVGGLECSADS